MKLNDRIRRAIKKKDISTLYSVIDRHHTVVDAVAFSIIRECYKYSSEEMIEPCLNYITNKYDFSKNTLWAFCASGSMYLFRKSIKLLMRLYIIPDHYDMFSDAIDSFALWDCPDTVARKSIIFMTMMELNINIPGTDPGELVSRYIITREYKWLMKQPPHIQLLFL